MRLELKVTHTPNSKSKRPWERWTWLGSKTGSLLLLAQNRIKVLNLQDRGSSVKKKVTKLSSLQNSAIITSTTRDGQYLLGYLESGDIFIWNKDQDTLRMVKGHPSISVSSPEETGQKSESFKLYATNDLNNILLVKGHKSIYLWEINQPESVLRLREAELKGTWYLIGGDKAPLPGVDSAEAVSDAVFMVDPVLGRSCVWSAVFYQGDDIQISTVLIRWFEPWHQEGMHRYPSFSVRWLSSKHSIRSLSPSSWPVNHHGALVASYNNSGRVLAVALNQRSPHEAKMAFISPLTAAATVVDLKSCGCKAKRPHADHVKTYWLSDMTWTHNDLFLVCITKRGSVAVLPRLSEPILLQCEGCSVEHSPAYFLPLLNLITVLKPSSLSGDRPPSPTSSLTSEADEGRQRFSVSCHSSSPLILCSDGYLGLVLEFPADLTCSSILGDYLSEGATALHLIYSARDLGPVGLGSLRREPASPNLQSAQHRTFSNMIDMLATADSFGLESTQSSDLGHRGQFGNMTSGRLLFDDSAMMSSTQSLGFLPIGNHSIESLIQWTQMAALSAWGVGVSHAGPWNARLEYLMQYTIKVFMALFWILLRKDENIKLPTQTRKSISGAGDGAIDQKLHKVLSLYKAILVSSLWDSFGSHSMYSYLRLSRSLVKRLLKGQVCDQTSMTRCCIAVLHTSEQVLTQVYTRRPISEPSCNLSLLSFHPSDTVEHALAGQRMHSLAIMPSRSSTRKRRQVAQSERSGSRTEGPTKSRSKKRETRSETSSMPAPEKVLAPSQGRRVPLPLGGAVSIR
nr:ciliogenesis and planar polarity effector 1-like [Lytechinus pictus]